MKAIICTRYGPPEVLVPADVPTPVPGAGEVLIQIHSTTCHFGDVRVRSALVPLWLQLPFRLYMGVLKPKRRILGMELSGRVVAAGEQVANFRPGDAVLAATPFRLGAYAEYICLPARGVDVRQGLVVPKPAAMNFAEAAAGLASGGLTALNLVRKAGLGPGQRVLVYGASGSVGLYALQLARHSGAVVTGVCSSRNHELARSFGAAAVIDYTQGELETCTERFDVVIDAVGKLPRALGRRLLTAAGELLSVARDVGPVGALTLAELQYLCALVDSGALRTFIDREYALHDIVAAHRYVEQGHKRAHVVLRVDPNAESP